MIDKNGENKCASCFHQPYVGCNLDYAGVTERDGNGNVLSCAYYVTRDDIEQNSDDFISDDGIVGISGDGTKEFSERFDLLAAEIEQQEQQKQDDVDSITAEEIDALLFANEHFRSENLDAEKLEAYREIVSKVEALYRGHPACTARGYDILDGNKRNAHAWLEIGSIGHFDGASLFCFSELFALSDAVYSAINPEMEMRFTFTVYDVYV